MPTERMGPCWRAVALPVLSGFAGVERHHVHAMQFEQFNLGNGRVPHPARIYSWAGRYRQVNLAKGDFPFAAAAQIPRLMTEFERGPLRRFTPCGPAPTETLATALAVVHVELVLIHPFREGNGRVARMLAVLMGLQAGLPALFFDRLAGRRRQRYFAAVRAGLGRDYEPMAQMFSAVIERTLQIHRPH